MEFDDRLRRAFDALADSLQQDIAARLTAVRGDLADSLQAEREAAMADAARDARSAAEQEAAEHAAAVARQANDLRSQLTEAEHAASERLLDAVRAIDGAQGLTEILDVLVGAASAEVGRAGIFLPQGATLNAWRLVGFDAPADGETVTDVALADGGVIAEAAESGRVARLEAGTSRRSVAPAFADLPQQSRAVAVPLVMSGQVFAIVYADEGSPTAAMRESWPASIEILARHAARALEAVTASRFAQVAEGAGFSG